MTMPDATMPDADADAVGAAVDEAPWRRLSIRMLAVHPVRELLRAWPVLIGVLFLGTRSGVGGGLWGLIGVGIVVVKGLMRWFTTTYRMTGEQVQVRRGVDR